VAAVGLYGVTSYAVNLRRTEIGIRMALGATRGSVIRLVLGRVAILTGIGIITGLAAGAWASRFVATLLSGLEPVDPGTLIAAAVTFALISAVAGWLPAARASRLDPTRIPRGLRSPRARVSPTVSAPPRCLDGGDVDFLHRHHRLEGTLGLGTASRKRVG
jgi:ABC-type lipoprotein release transport system permease subunit